MTGKRNILPNVKIPIAPWNRLGLKVIVQASLISPALASPELDETSADADARAQPTK